jgi:hypothetical protein
MSSKRNSGSEDVCLLVGKRSCRELVYSAFVLSTIKLSLSLNS